MLQRFKHIVETVYVVLDPRVDEISAAYDPGATVKELGRAVNADVAMNFNFADTAVGVPLGRLIVNGITVIPDIPKTVPRDELYMLPDRSVHIGKAPAGAVWAVQGSPRLLRDGKVVMHESIQRDQLGEDVWGRRAERVAAGITNDGRLVLARTLGPVYLSDLAEIMAQLGCVDALNGDGGGSSYMWPEDSGWGRKLGSALIVKRGGERVFKIAIDAGHGPETPGKRSPDGSLREYQFNSAVARYVADELLHGYEGVEILMTHADDRDVPLKERTDRANAWKADLFVSIHANAAGDGGWNGAQGIETFVYTTRPAAATKLAEAVHRNLIRATGRPDRGVKTANFHVLRETKMPAILVECGFMTNQEEAALLKTDTYRRKCAAAIVAGIVEVYGLRKKPAETAPAPTPSTPVGELPRVSGTARVVVNGQDIGVGYIIDGRTYVPLRAVGDAMGMEVGWDQTSKTASLKGGK